MYDSPRQAGIIAINFRDDDDELIGAEPCSGDDDVLLISRKGQAIRFPADDHQLRPMGRATSGVSGMRFRPGDELLSMSIISAESAEHQLYVFTVTDGGFAKRTEVADYRQQGRGGYGIKAMRLNEDRGSLVGGLIVTDTDEVIAIKASGQVTRSAVVEVAVKGRDTMGVKFVGVRDNDPVVVIALNPETTAEVAKLESADTDDVVPVVDSDDAGNGALPADAFPVEADDIDDDTDTSTGDASPVRSESDQDGLDPTVPEGAVAEEEDSE
jgi:DNA gyrase subunit A